MAFSLRKPTALFVDGANLSATCKELNMYIDWNKVLIFCGREYDIVRAFYYTGIYEEESGNKPLQQMVDYLNLNGYSVRSKVAKSYITSQGLNRIKGNMDVEIAVDMMRMSKHTKHMFLFSGDGDFRYLVDAVQSEGVRVTVVSSFEASICSKELRKQADEFIELSDLRVRLKRER